MPSKYDKEGKKLSKKFMEYINKKYPNDDDIIPEYEQKEFLEKYASKEYKDYIKRKDKLAKKGITID